MADTQQSGEGLGATALEPTRQDLRLVRHAVRGLWPVSDRVRQLVVDMAEGIIESPGENSLRKLAAGKLLVTADSVNVRREANAVQERQGEPPGLAAMREALRNPAYRAAAAAALEQLCATAPATLSADEPPAHS
jgi:hypothetical protein